MTYGDPTVDEPETTEPTAEPETAPAAPVETDHVPHEAPEGVDPATFRPIDTPHVDKNPPPPTGERDCYTT